MCTRGQATCTLRADHVLVCYRSIAKRCCFCGYSLLRVLKFTAICLCRDVGAVVFFLPWLAMHCIKLGLLVCVAFGRVVGGVSQVGSLVLGFSLWEWLGVAVAVGWRLGRFAGSGGFSLALLFWV